MKKWEYFTVEAKVSSDDGFIVLERKFGAKSGNVKKDFRRLLDGIESQIDSLLNERI